MESLGIKCSLLGLDYSTELPTSFNNTSAPIAMHKILLTGLVFVFAVFGSSYGQTKKNPVSYHNVQWSGQLAQFSFADLGEREVLSTKKMTFYAPEKVEMDFRVKIRPDGTVSYVGASRCDKDMEEFRRGGTSALYGYTFSQSEEDSGDQWVQVKMVVGE